MELTPRQIVNELDKFIVGQTEAKKAVAIALRNRFRRRMVDEPLRSEITPKNILMIGPTGVGKTEIARRLAKLANAPFIKVEATKFTEVGYMGKDVDSIIRDLMDIAIKDNKARARENNIEQARTLAEEQILDILLPPARTNDSDENNVTPAVTETGTRERFRKMFKTGKLDDKEIEVEINVARSSRTEIIMGPPALEELAGQLQGIFDANLEPKKKKCKMTIAEALPILINESQQKLVNEEEVIQQSISNVEEDGIVFLDEIDKVAVRNNSGNADVSRAGVQRDLLPLVEGTTVSTKYGMIKTDHILFISSGAFHIAKPSDLLPELQGRFPIRVELNSLTVSDFEKILTSTDACLTAQYKALLATENVHIDFTADGIKKMAEIAFNVNEKTENIGARRLYTVIEKLLEDISFEPENHTKTKINAKFVESKLGGISKSEDLSHYIL